MKRVKSQLSVLKSVWESFFKTNKCWLNYPASCSCWYVTVTVSAGKHCRLSAWNEKRLLSLTKSSLFEKGSQFQDGLSTIPTLYNARKCFEIVICKLLLSESSLLFYSSYWFSFSLWVTCDTLTVQVRELVPQNTARVAFACVKSIWAASGWESGICASSAVHYPAVIA